MTLALFIMFLLAVPPPHVQVFVDLDDNASTGYGRNGFECVIRPATLEAECGIGDWGAALNARVYLEMYLPEGEYVCHTWFRADVSIVTFDADCDGDVDLADFAEFQRGFTGE